MCKYDDGIPEVRGTSRGFLALRQRRIHAERLRLSPIGIADRRPWNWPEPTAQKVKRQKPLKPRVGRTLICVETKQRFNTIKAAAASVGVCPNAVANSINGGMSGGLHFVDLRTSRRIQGRRQKCRPVVCIETGQQWLSLADAIADLSGEDVSDCNGKAYHRWHARATRSLSGGKAIAGVHLRHATAAEKPDVRRMLAALQQEAA